LTILFVGKPNRFLHHRWLGALGLHPAWRTSSELGDLLGDEHPCLNFN
jgi:hypothetical protein